MLTKKALTATLARNTLGLCAYGKCTNRLTKKVRRTLRGHMHDLEFCANIGCVEKFVSRFFKEDHLILTREHATYHYKGNKLTKSEFVMELDAPKKKSGWKTP